MRIKRTYVVPYSLIELLAAMTVFSLLMLSLMQFLGSAQKIWTGSNAKTEMFEDARIALNLIARDLQCSLYEDDFYGPYRVQNQVGASDFDRIDFVAKLAEKPTYSSGTSETKIAEIRYWWVGNDSDDTKCWRLYRSVVGDKLGYGVSTSAWNYSYCDNTNWSTIFPDTADIDPGGVVNSAAVIPYVVDFSIKPLKSDSSSGTGLTEITDQSEFPYAVVITLSLLERGDYEKWRRLGSTDTDHVLVKNNKRTFSKIVFLGDRGQN